MKAWVCLFFLACLSLSCDRNEPEITNGLKGQWIWKSTCGGIVGCVPAPTTISRILTISSSEMKIVNDGNIAFEKTYYIKNVSIQDNSKLYEVEFNDGIVWTVTLTENQLATDYASVIYSVYSRL